MKYLKSFNESLNENSIETSIQALCDIYDFDISFNNSKDRAVSHSTTEFKINKEYLTELQRLNAKIKSMGYESSASCNIMTNKSIEVVRSDKNLDNFIAELNKFVGFENIRTLIRIKRQGSKHDIVFDDITEVVSGVMNYEYWENSEGGYMIALLTNEGDIIGTLEYHHIPADNPFYMEGEYPENEYVIEINDATEIDGELDLDNIRLVPVINSSFDKDNLEGYLEEFDV